jgi:sugar phosphate isomerase/epimerase
MSEAAAIQCSTGAFWTFELEEALDLIAEAGFKEIELMVTRDPSTQEPDLPLRLTTERGLKIGSIHAPFLVITKTVWGLDPVEKIRRGREMCAALGCDSIIVHPPYLWERGYTRWLKNECRDFCSETEIIVAVETMYPRWVAGRRVRAYKWLEVGELAAAVPYVALDTSHVTVARQDILDAYSVAAPKLHHIHLSDNAGDGRDGHLEFGQGILPIERFLTELRQTEYEGVVSLELSLRHYVEDRASLISMLRRNREYIEERLKRDPRVPKGMPRTEEVGTPWP